MATIITRYVNTDSTAGGDGTTNNTSGATRAFATQDEARSVIQAAYTSFVASDVQVDVKHSAPSGVADVAPVAPGGVAWSSTMDATRYVRLMANTGHEATMVWSNSRYRLQQGSSYYCCISLASGKIVIEGLQLENTGGNRANGGGCIQKIVSTGVGTYEVRRCYGRASAGGSPALECALVNLYTDTASTLIVENCVGYNMGCGVYVTNGGTAHTIIFDNNTFVGNLYGFVVNENGNTLRLRNNLCSGNTTQDCYINVVTGGTYQYLTNLSSDASSPNSALRNKTVTFVNAGTGDYHLSGSDASAKDAGTDLSADSYHAFTTDFDNATRSGTWDIGAAEYVAGAGGTLFQLTNAGLVNGLLVNNGLVKSNRGRN